MIPRSLQQRVKRIPILGGIARWARNLLIGRMPGMFLATDTPSAQETRRHLGFAVDYVYHSQVEGDLAEFGTASGVSAVAIARAMVEVESKAKGPSPRKLLLFDSFEGLPVSTAEPDLNSPQVKTGVWSPGECKVLTKDKLVSAVVGQGKIAPDRVVTYEGWYKDTVPKLHGSTKLALIHVDCDLYQSTIDALDPLFSAGQVAEGAAIMFDDWNCNRASPLCGERKAWSELVEKYSIRFSDGGDYSWGCHKILVHEYRGDGSSAAQR